MEGIFQARWRCEEAKKYRLEKMVCSKCGTLSRFEATLFKGPEPPDCAECIELESVRGVAGKRSLGVGKLRPRIVLYNEFNPDADAIGAVTNADLRARPDALLVVGTSLKIPGVRRIVREMCAVVQDYRGGKTVWINESDPPTGKEFDGAFDIVVRGDCEKVAKLADFPRWDGSQRPVSDAASDTDSYGSFVEVTGNTHEYRVEVQIPHRYEVLPETNATAKLKPQQKKSKPKRKVINRDPITRDGTVGVGWRVSKAGTKVPMKVAQSKEAVRHNVMNAPPSVQQLFPSPATSTRTPSPSSLTSSPLSSPPLSSPMSIANILN